MTDKRKLPKGWYEKLTYAFRSPKHIRDYRRPRASTALALFAKTQSFVYNNIINAYGQYDRLSRYSDFTEMEYTPEIAAALDIYADEAVSQDDKGRSLHIYTDNPKLESVLDDLFNNVLNVEFNLRMWVRNLVKYGDFFLFNDVAPGHGIVNVFPIPVNEVEREEGFDPNDPWTVRFRWVTQGNVALENWQVTHFRLLGNDAFLPYGTSVIEPARRIWRQLILIEDAMLVYRVVRSPERRVFYIDVRGVPPDKIEDYMQEQISRLRSNPVVDTQTGRVDLRYNPLSVDEDYFIPRRGPDSGTTIESLKGGEHVSAIEDVEYIQKKLFAALKIPRAYLGYDETISSKATLAQEDIRFSRTIQTIQKVIIAELYKLAYIHLFTLGMDDQVGAFELRLNNPSSVAQLQKLELLSKKIEIADAARRVNDGKFFSKQFIMRNVFDMSDEMQRRMYDELIEDAYLEHFVDKAIEGANPFDIGVFNVKGVANSLISDIITRRSKFTSGDVDVKPKGVTNAHTGPSDEEDIEEAPGGGLAGLGSFARLGDEELPGGAFEESTSNDGVIILEDDDDGADDDEEPDTLEKMRYNRRRRKPFGKSTMAIPDMGTLTDTPKPPSLDDLVDKKMSSIPSLAEVSSNPFVQRHELQRIRMSMVANGVAPPRGQTRSSVDLVLEDDDVVVDVDIDEE